MYTRRSKTKSSKPGIRKSLVMGVLSACLTGSVLWVWSGVSAESKPVLLAAVTAENMEAMRQIDSATSARVEAIANYTVQEKYAIYRNGSANSSAEITVQTVSTQAAGKEYTQLSHSGSAILRDAVIERILSNEKTMSSAVNRESVWITSANYQMQVEPGRAMVNGRECLVVDLVARRKSPFLFNGKAWFDATDFTIVRLEGIPSQSASIFAGVSSLTRDYAKVEGFSMATHAEAHSHSFLLGDTVLKIDYTGYKIQRSGAPMPK